MGGPLHPGSVHKSPSVKYLINRHHQDMRMWFERPGAGKWANVLGRRAWESIGGGDHGGASGKGMKDEGLGRYLVALKGWQRQKPVGG